MMTTEIKAFLLAFILDCRTWIDSVLAALIIELIQRSVQLFVQDTSCVKLGVAVKSTTGNRQFELN